MGLVNCVKCGHLVSTSAVKCPKCNEKLHDRLAELLRKLDDQFERRQRYEKEHQKEIESFANTPIFCPECNAKRPLKFYLLTTLEYFVKEREPKQPCLTCPNCGHPIYIKCDLCVKKWEIFSGAVVYKHIDGRGYKLCPSHRDIETSEGVDKTIHYNRYCEDCGKRKIFGFFHLCLHAPDD